MVAGLRLQNPDGYAQLDDRFQNFVLIQKGTLTLGAPWTYFSTTGGPFGTITVPDYYGYPPLIVLRTGTFVAMRDAIRDGSGNWVFGLAGIYASASGATVDYYVFGPPHGGLAKDNYGLQINRAGGQLGYHSSWKPLRVVGQIGNGGQGLSWTGVGGRAYGVAHVLDSFQQSAPLPSGTWRVNGTGSVHRVNGVTAELSTGQYYTTVWGTFPPFSTEYNQPEARHLVIDLTHY